MKPSHCDDRRLMKILDDTSSDKHQDTVDHLDDCVRCQSRLIELAADGDSWTVAKDALRDSDVYRNRSDGENNDFMTRSLSGYDANGSVIIAVDAELSPDIPVQADRVSLDFLQPASHPEMLGRVGQYDVERLIGAGGMGIVFKAFDSELHRPVAVKVLAPHLAHSGGARQRFAREAQSAAAVVHENVVPIHYVDTQSDLPFLVMQYVAGESLQARVDRDGPLGADEILQIGIQIARGLSAAHDQGLVHRDVKPGNILLEPAINRVLITDFGLARAADDASVTRSGIIAGTPHYMSPEQAKGLKVDSKSDLFGLGGVLYFMATGRPAFRADGAMAVLNKICSTEHRPVDEVNEQVPADLAELTDGLLAKDPATRPVSAEAVANALSEQLKSFRSGRPRFRKRRRSMKWRLVTRTAGVAVLLGLAWLAWLMRLPPVNAPGYQAPGVPATSLADAYAPPIIATGADVPIAGANSASIAPMHQPIPAADALTLELSRQMSELEGKINEYEFKWSPHPTAIQPASDPLPGQIEELSRQVDSFEFGP